MTLIPDQYPHSLRWISTLADRDAGIPLRAECSCGTRWMGVPDEETMYALHEDHKMAPPLPEEPERCPNGCETWCRCVGGGCGYMFRVGGEQRVCIRLACREHWAGGKACSEVNVLIDLDTVAAQNKIWKGTAPTAGAFYPYMAFEWIDQMADELRTLREFAGPPCECGKHASEHMTYGDTGRLSVACQVDGFMTAREQTDAEREWRERGRR